MTNGTLTKQMLKAAKTQDGQELIDTAKAIMRRFPLSSHKLLYDDDKARVGEAKFALLEQAAIATDEEKMRDCNRMLKEVGCKPYTSYGRFSVKGAKAC